MEQVDERICIFHNFKGKVDCFTVMLMFSS